MDVHEIVQKLIGPIEPVGETHTDDIRFENLEKMTELVDLLLGDIYALMPYRDRYEFSLKRAGEHATKFLQEVKDAD